MNLYSPETYARAIIESIAGMSISPADLSTLIAAQITQALQSQEARIASLLAYCMDADTEAMEQSATIRRLYDRIAQLESRP